MDEKLIDTYDQQAALYEKLRRKRWHIDHAWRKKLLGDVNGKILEVSVGAAETFDSTHPVLKLLPWMSVRK